jgi:tetratricopeptide (TPR) repeat protein/cellulose biosynthesis protein BcsQ
MSRIVTFYSYKGGVGRTFALANVAVSLAQRGKRVLLMDWDLEAPGLHRYFKPHLLGDLLPKQGVIHLLSQALENPKVRWEPFVAEVQIENNPSLFIISSGDQDPNYVERVRDFSWTDFFENRQGGEVLDRWRAEWKGAFDFVLVDSRTGITDIGGVCTVFLPDILVLVFSANEQSFERGIQIVLGVQESRRKLAVHRPPVTVLPLPGRFDGRDEVDEAKTWLERFAQELKPFYDDWLPKQFKPLQILELTKIPYVTKFSFGEPLPVLSHGVTDPELPGFYLENVARLLASDFQDAAQIVAPEGDEGRFGLAEFRARLAQVPINEADVNESLSQIENVLGEGAALSELLAEAGVALLLQRRFESAETYFRRVLSMSDRELGPNHPCTVSSLNYLAELLRLTKRLFEAEQLYRRALLRELASDPSDPAVVSTYNNLAAVLREMGRLSEAEEVYRQALYRLERDSRSGDLATVNTARASTYHQLGQIAQEQRRWVEAEQYYQKALAIYIEFNDRTAQASTYHQSGLVAQEQRRWVEAEQYYQKALAIYIEFNDRYAQANAYHQLGRVTQAQRQWVPAEEYYQKALAIKIELNDRYAQANTYHNLGVVAQAQRQWVPAEEYYQTALAIKIEFNDRYAQASTYHN